MERISTEPARKAAISDMKANDVRTSILYQSANLLNVTKLNQLPKCGCSNTCFNKSLEACQLCQYD